MAELEGWLTIRSLVGFDATLWHPEVRKTLAPRQGLVLLREAVKEAKASLVVLDGVNDTFAGNENDRGDVRAYVNERGQQALSGPILASYSKNAANG